MRSSLLDREARHQKISDISCGSTERSGLPVDRHHFAVAKEKVAEMVVTVDQSDGVRRRAGEDFDILGAETFGDLVEFSRE